MDSVELLMRLATFRRKIARARPSLTVGVP